MEYFPKAWVLNPENWICALWYEARHTRHFGGEKIAKFKTK